MQQPSDGAVGVMRAPAAYEGAQLAVRASGPAATPVREGGELMVGLTGTMPNCDAVRIRCARRAEAISALEGTQP